MNDLKKEFSEYTSEYLLELRARGESLGDTTHQVIEEIFAERGERLPEKPEKPIISSRKKAVKESKSTTMFQIIGLVFTLFISAVITEITKTERLLQLIALAIVIG